MRALRKECVYIKCGMCGEVFGAYTLAQKYCSPQCKKKARKITIDKSNNRMVTPKKHKKQIINIIAINEQARSQRLSYGQLVAREWMVGGNNA